MDYHWWGKRMQRGVTDRRTTSAPSSAEAGCPVGDGVVVLLLGVIGRPAHLPVTLEIGAGGEGEGARLPQDLLTDNLPQL